MTHFLLKPHAITPATTVIEVWEGPEMIGTLYPSDRGFRLVSNYLGGVDLNKAIHDQRDTAPPAIEVTIWDGHPRRKYVKRDDVALGEN